LGTLKFRLLLDSATIEPPAGAGAVKVTVQLEVPGATTVAGEQLKTSGREFEGGGFEGRGFEVTVSVSD
jgi:hypothetical protein